MGNEASVPEGREAGTTPEEIAAAADALSGVSPEKQKQKQKQRRMQQQPQQQPPQQPPQQLPLPLPPLPPRRRLPRRSRCSSR